MIQVLLGVLSAALIAAVAIAKQYFEARITPIKLSQVGEFARVAVNAAERIGIDTPDLTGADKYDIAYDTLIELAERVGIKLSLQEAMSLIHAALNELRAFDSPPIAPANVNILDWLDQLPPEPEPLPAPIPQAPVEAPAAVVAEVPLTPVEEPNQPTLTLVPEDSPAG